jgi:hypothetical protein
MGRYEVHPMINHDVDEQWMLEKNLSITRICDCPAAIGAFFRCDVERPAAAQSVHVEDALTGKLNATKV